ncbi:hypothetical protein B0T26DRAFT_430871 [Lasiosphaeria miniovina]|uniref:Uncharacterized protein n=1 Tax=Lasiosphaeria miniovina TaxID=1954250 RepID=A0AA40A665_9PEZI|nr:uncharacterized protein B0T26DRAFT_430871 [Lasiosphaeria miniovina]KAK0710036.1 hypothetical protein B0T26DRAFT_430871 [Lasiosphaeria miniovina]
MVELRTVEVRTVELRARGSRECLLSSTSCLGLHSCKPLGSMVTPSQSTARVLHHPGEVLHHPDEERERPSTSEDYRLHCPGHLSSFHDTRPVSLELGCQRLGVLISRLGVQTIEDIMEDWGKLSAIIAIVTLSVNIFPLILVPLFRNIFLKLQQLVYRGYYRCEAIGWDGLHDRGLSHVPTLQAATSATSELDLVATRPQIPNLVAFFDKVWRAKPQPVARPSYLAPDKNYLRVDADALVAALLVDGTYYGLGGSGSGSDALPLGDSFSFQYGSTVKGQFQRFGAAPSTTAENTVPDPYIIGRLTGFPQHEGIRRHARGITKNDLKAIAAGYPPFYRRTVMCNSGAPVAHPIRTVRDIHRGAWLVAIGFSRAYLEPLGLYHGGQMGAYRGACGRVLHTLQRLQTAYHDHVGLSTTLDAAVRGVARMNANTSGSGLPTVTAGTALQGCEDNAGIGATLSAPDVAFAMDLFRDFGDGPLIINIATGRDRERADRVLEEAIRAAVSGVYIWWQYVNNASRPLPGWMRDESIRQCPIWIEEGGGVAELGL